MDWKPDVLPGFEQLTLELTPDDEGPVVATLVRRVAPSSGAFVAPEFDPDSPEAEFNQIGAVLPNPGSSHGAAGSAFGLAAAPPDNGVDVLYIHGWVDYFYQTHLAAFFESQGYRFYALDLRKYGRSLRDWQTPGYVDSLSIYDEDINAALTAMGHGVVAAPDVEGDLWAGSAAKAGTTRAGMVARMPDDENEEVGSPKLSELLRNLIESARSGYADAAGVELDPVAPSGMGTPSGTGTKINTAPTDDDAPRDYAEPHDYQAQPPHTEFKRIPGTGRWLLLMGHSTGGLIAALWAAYNPGRADALVLNSPWLEFQTGNLGRRALEGPIKAQARIAPMSHLVNPDPGYYVKSISNQFDGEWDINLDWKPVVMWAPTAAWMAAIFRAQDRVALGLDLDIPVLVLLSAKSTWPVRWSPELLETDQVITVDDVAARAPSLGHIVTTVRFPGALHDVTLSTPEVRANVWSELSRWLAAYIQ